MIHVQREHAGLAVTMMSRVLTDQLEAELHSPTETLQQP